VIASRWDIDSRSTTGLMTLFYRSFKARMSGAQALKAARRELSSRDQFGHPYYWAGIEIFTSN
jgi:CHAT domain-containing protein